MFTLIAGVLQRKEMEMSEIEMSPLVLNHFKATADTCDL